MSEQDPGFTEADRRAIAEIRRELDADFGLLEEVAPLDVQRQRGGRGRRPRAGGSSVVVAARCHRGVRHRPSARGARGRGRNARVARSRLRADAADDALGGRTSERAHHAAAAAAAREDPALRSLHDALDEWLDATRRGDIPAQMRFYPGRVPVYYTWGDVPRDTVRAEKVKVYGAATTLEIDAGPPAIELAADGATAVTSFRKRYVIEGPKHSPSRRGAPGATVGAHDRRLDDRQRAGRRVLADD
jgi:hypothetical protein